MSTSTQTLAYSFSTDALFRTFIQNIETALAACGLVHVTSETGQLDPTTITKPTAGWSWATGYRMWRFDDALQSTQPVFLRFQYGTSDAATAPLIGLTVGFATDGAGTFVGNYMDIAAPGQFANSTYNTPTASCYWSGDGSRLQFAWWNAGTADPYVLFSVERGASNTGLVTFSYAYFNGQYYMRTRWVPYSGSTGWQTDGHSGFYVPSALTSGQNGNNTYTWGFRPYFPAEAPCGGSGFLMAFPADVALGQTYSIDVNGVAKTYRCVAVTYLNSKFTPMNTQGSYKAMLMRWA